MGCIRKGSGARGEFRAVGEVELSEVNFEALLEESFSGEFGLTFKGVGSPDKISCNTAEDESIDRTTSQRTFPLRRKRLSVVSA